ncbi:MAG: zinc ribbon domain-containing protein [Candidatus Lokiarchaeota archaeon]
MTKNNCLSGPKYCPNCGKELSPIAKICKFCGERLESPEFTKKDRK